MTETKNQRKTRLKQEREAKALVDKENEYISPIIEELGFQTRPIGEGVEFYLDEDNERLLLDIDIGTRRNITQSGKSIKIATATHMIKGLMKLSLNIFDKDMNDQELDDLVIFLKNKKRRDELEKQRKSME